MKKVFIRTFGCQMNSNDSEFVAGIFKERGYGLADSPEKADIILFNTCSVRGHAEERAINNMAILIQTTGRRHQTSDGKRQKKKIFGIFGCMAQAMKEKLFDRLPGLNIVCGTGQIAKLPCLVEDAQHGKVLALKGIDAHLPEIRSSYRKDRRHTYVSIMRGCNNYCSYCIVPYVRGKERSRSVKDIVKEVKELAKNGTKNITLLGQNVNSYKGKPGCNFVKLLRILHKINGIEEIGFLTSHPKDASAALFRVMRDLPKIRKHLHLPLQSGSDRILRAMNRRYTRRRYLSLVNSARRIVTDLRLTTDIIIGFPGESDTDFKHTLDLMEKIRFDAAYIFKYSPRSGTKAFRLKDSVPLAVKKKRHSIILDFQRRIAGERK